MLGFEKYSLLKMVSLLVSAMKEHGKCTSFKTASMNILFKMGSLNWFSGLNNEIIVSLSLSELNLKVCSGMFFSGNGFV